MKKVYCDNCKWYYFNYIILNRFTGTWHRPRNEDCYAKENRKYLENHRRLSYELIKLPCEINKNNDCKWFKNRSILNVIFN